MSKTIKEKKAPIQGFIRGQEEPLVNDYQEILNVLLDGDTNLDLKTHIIRPKQLAALFTVANVLETCEYTKSSKLLHDFIKQYLNVF